MDTKQIEKQLGRLWATRPLRSESRTVAGICNGVGERYRVDPTLVKIAFVVAAVFGGSGVLLYLAAWLAFPSARGAGGRVAVSPQGVHSGPGRRGRHGPGGPKLMLLVVVAVIVLTSLGPNRTWGSGALLGLVLMLAGWWLLFVRTPIPPAGTSVDTARQVPPPDQFDRWVPRAALSGYTITPGAAQTVTMTESPSARTEALLADSPDSDASDPDRGDDTSAPVSLTDDTGTAPTPAPSGDVPTVAVPTQTQPPRWDPLGTARFAWDLPEPAEQTPPPSPRPRRLALVVIGLAVLVAAAGAAANRAGADWFTVPHILSITLAVVGAGLVVVAGLRRRDGEHSAGLIPIAVALGAAVVVSTAATAGTGLHHRIVPSGGVGKSEWTPMSENDLRDDYSHGVGEADLDLSRVTLTRDHHVQVNNGIGQVSITVPSTMRVRVDCHTGIGDTHCPDGIVGGSHGPLLMIDAHNGIGKVEVMR